MAVNPYPIEPMAAELLEFDLLTTFIEYGKLFFRDPANLAKYEAWKANRNAAKA